MKRSSRLGGLILLLFALPFAGVGAFVLSLAYRTVRESNEMQRWMPVPVHLLAVDLESHQGDDSTTYKATARYAYRVNGRMYESTRVGLHSGSDNIGHWHEQRHNELKQIFQSGGTTTAYVNPINPNEAVLFPAVRREMLLFYAGFGGIFFVVGLGIFVGGLVSFVRSGATSKRAREFPEEPWRWREDWASGVIKSSNRGLAIGLLVFAAFWSGFIGFIFAMMLQDRASVPLPVWGVLGLFQLIGVGLLVWAIREWRVAKRYGAALLHLASVPGVIGGKLAGVVALPDYAEPYESYRIQLACEEQVRRGKNTSTETRWKAERSLDPAQLPAKVDGVQIPVLFAIPFGLPSSGGKITWRLRVNAKQPGIDVDVKFEVPVFQTPESQPDFQLDESGIRPFLLEAK